MTATSIREIATVSSRTNKWPYLSVPWMLICSLSVSSSCNIPIILIKLRHDNGTLFESKSKQIRVENQEDEAERLQPLETTWRYASPSSGPRHWSSSACLFIVFCYVSSSFFLFLPQHTYTHKHSLRLSDASSFRITKTQLALPSDRHTHKYIYIYI